jgi:hypothetical protein
MYAYLNPFILLYISHKAQHDYSVCRFLFLSFPTHVRGFGGGGASICFYGGWKKIYLVLSFCWRNNICIIQQHLIGVIWIRLKRCTAFIRSICFRFGGGRASFLNCGRKTIYLVLSFCWRKNVCIIQQHLMGIDWMQHKIAAAFMLRTEGDLLSIVWSTYFLASSTAIGMDQFGCDITTFCAASNNLVAASSSI